MAGLAATSGLAACASNLPVDERRGGKTGQGAILLRLVTDGRLFREPNEDEPADFADEVRSAVVIRAGANGATHRVRLMRVHGGTQSSVLMGGFAEPGRYHLAWIEDDEEAVMLDPDLMRFEVTPGTLSLLGTLVVEKIERNADGEDRVSAIGHLPADVEADKVAIGALPALWSLGQAGRIAAAPAAPKLVAAQARARRFKDSLPPQTITEPLNSGEFVSRGRLGVFYLRPRRRSTAIRIDTGSSVELTSVQRYRGGLMVGGEEGLLRFSSDEGKRWEQVPSPSPGLIRLIAPLQDGGLAVLVRYGHTWSVHVTDDPWRARWRQTAEFSFRELRDTYQPPAFATTVGDKICLMHYRGGFVLFEARSGRVTRPWPKAPPTSALVWARAPSVISFGATPDGLLVMRGNRAGLITEASIDDGQNWADLNLPRSLVAFAFRDRRVGHAIGVPTGGREHEMLTTRDAGATWVRTGRSPLADAAQVVRLDIDRVDGALLAQLKNGRVMRSMDEGGSWVEDPS